MRQLTLKGYLENYLIELSYSGTASVSKLIKELPRNPRLREPLIIYAIESETSTKICKRDIGFYEEYVKVKACSDVRTLSRNYEKVIDSYNYARNKKSNDDELKGKMHTRIIFMQQEKQISNYRIYKELNLNASNVNYFLKHGDCGKLSIDTVRRIWRYLEDI